MSLLSFFLGDLRVKVEIDTSEIVNALTRIAVAIDKLATAVPSPNKGLELMITVKDDNPGGSYSITGGETVTDAEGHLITDPAVLASLVREVTSDDESVLALEPDAENPFSGSFSFGGPGVATVTAHVSLPDGTVLASGTQSFTVTTGDPAAVSPISMSFGDLVDVPPTE